MNKQKKLLLAKTYKQYSRQKYNKLKHQFPRMRQSDIINKIIKEWERMPPKQKQAYYQRYQHKDTFEDQKSISQDSEKISSKKRQLVKEAKIKRQKEPNSQSIRIKHDDQAPSIADKSDKAPSVKKSVGDRQSDSQRSFGLAKTKQIKKNKVDMKNLRNYEYLQFFKYYYERLTQQHPKWTATQVSTIIKLLWKKRNMKTKKPKNKRQHTSMRRMFIAKKVSGRLAFKKQKLKQGFDKEYIIALWRKLPIQSKLHWQRKGSGYIRRLKRMEQSLKTLKTILKSGIQKQREIIEKPLLFLQKRIS